MVAPVNRPIPSPTLGASYASTPSIPEKFEDKFNCPQTKPLFDERRPYVKPDPKHSKVLLAQAFIDPMPMVTKGESDPEAYVALFNLAAACFPETMFPGKIKKRVIEGCPNLEMKLNGHPIEFLKRAAELGSVEAKLSYALNARLYARFYRSDTANGTGDTVKDVIERAERYGAEAAQAGHPDAYRYMSGAYENGLFGQRDLTRALAFSLPLMKLGDESDKQHVANLTLRATKNERDSAEAYAFGCNNRLSGSALVSPF